MTQADSREPQLELSYPEAELVFGLVYPVGTDYTGVQLTLENFVKRFNFTPNTIRLSWRDTCAPGIRGTRQRTSPPVNGISSSRLL